VDIAEADARAPARVQPEPRTWAEFALLSAIWGPSYLFIKVALTDGLSPVMLVATRLAIAAAFLVVVVRLAGGRAPRDREAVLTFAFLGAVNVAVPWLLISWGTQWIPSALSSILNALTPLVTILVASLVLHDEPITVNRVAGLLLGFTGAVVLASPNLGPATGSGSAAAPNDEGLMLLGEAAVAAAAVCYAVGVVFARHRVTGRPLIEDPLAGRRAPLPIEVALWQVVAALGMSLPVAAGLELAGAGSGLPGSPVAWLSVAWLGVLGSGVAFVLSFRLIRTWGATRMSLVTYVIPVVAIVLGVVVLDEELHPAELLGTLMILSGVVLTSSRRGGRRLFGRSSTAVP
jgi:drug/metabolite transporter (DMT)-like permease